MAERPAKVRLELGNSGFLTALRQLEQEAKKFADDIEGIGKAGAEAEKKLHPALQSMKKGFGAAKQSLTEMGGALKSTLSQAATLGGALGVGSAVREATQLKSQYKDIAFAMELATGQAQDWRDVQKQVEQAADATKQRFGPLAEAFQKMAAGGGPEFAKQMLDDVGTAATATGDDVTMLGTLALDLKQKFGLAGEEMQGAFAAAIEKGKAAGISGAELADEMGSITSAAQAAGLKGAEGLNVLLATLSKVRPKVKDVAEAGQGIEQTFERLSDPGFFQNIEKAARVKLNIDVDRSDVTQRLRKVLSAGSDARKELSAATTGREEKAALEALTDPFEKAFRAAQAAGDSTEEATKKGLDAYDAALKEAAKSTGDFGKFQRQAAENVKDPARRLDDAINKFTKAFQKPEVTEAIEKLADAMPKLATLLSKVVSFGAENPMLAGAGFVGAKAGGAMLGSVGGDVAGAIGKSLLKQGKGIGAEIAQSAATHGKWGAAGTMLAKVAGPLVAAAIAFELGKAAIDKHFEGKSKDQGDLATGVAAAGAAAASGDRGKMEEAAQTLRQRIARAKDNQTGFSGALDTALGVGAEIVTGGAVKHDAQADTIAKASAELRELEKAMAKSGKEGNKAGDALQQTAAAARDAANALRRMVPSGQGGGGGTNGLPPAPSNRSGSSPT